MTHAGSVLPSPARDRRDATPADRAAEMHVRTAAEAARQACETDVHILGVSSIAAAHLTAVPELKAALKKQGRDDIMIIVGGVVPPQDYDALYAAGADAIFPPGTVIADAADQLIQKLNARPGQRAAENSRRHGSW